MRRLTASVTLLLACCCAGSCAGTLMSQASPAHLSLEQERQAFVHPFAQKWCGACHGPAGADRDGPEADLDLITLFARAPTGSNTATLLDIRAVLREHEMPPEDEPAPPSTDRQRMLAWLDRALAAATPVDDPGRVTMRRLSRIEYRNTVRDLFGITEDVTGEFPADDLGYGFDNIGAALSVSALHLETYAAAARRIAEFAIVAEDPSHPPRRFYEAEDCRLEGKVAARGDYVVFSSTGRVVLAVTLPRGGDYFIRVHAGGQQAGDEPARMAIEVDGKSRTVVDVPNDRKRPQTFERRLHIGGGKRNVSLAFLNDYFDKKHPDTYRRDRNLYVHWIEVVGPVDRRAIPESHQRLFAADPGNGPAGERARPILEAALPRVWRRPVRRDEVTRVARLVQAAADAGDSFEQAVQLAVQAMLVSPNFLFRIEPGGRGTDANARSELLGGYEMASRLSYLLWSSTPDSRLLQLAAKNDLRTTAAIDAEVKRMLTDDRADALATNFASQWLDLRSLDEATPDPRRFRTYSPALRLAMRRETELFFRAVLRENRPVRTLIDADFTFLNATLAAHYGIAGFAGTDSESEFRRVALTSSRRGGVLTHASVLTVTSNPTRTSPVKRGKWILENILDDPVPPPEPGSDNFQSGADVTIAANLRAQLALHRKAQACAVCHNRMDALGLAMENYDPIGRWRDKDHGTPIDASGKLPDGRKLDGPTSLKAVLRHDDAFTRCLAKKLFLFATGREIRGTDKLALDRMVQSLPENPTMQDMILAITRLDAFRRRSLITAPVSEQGR